VTQLLALLLASSIGIIALWLRHDAKQRSRMAPDKDGWREPSFFLFDYAGGQWWFAQGLKIYAVILLVMLIV